MRNIILMFSIITILGGCSLGKLNPTTVSAPITLITTTIYPDFPDMSQPPKLGLNNPVWDIPRNTNAPMEIKRLTKCIKTPKEKRNVRFWAECGEYPPLENSNIYRGYSYDDFQLFLLNNSAIRGKLKSYKERIDEINRQRKEWREKNIKSRERLTSEKTKIGKIK